MIVEPVPTNPRTPIRRALRVFGLTVPVLLLVAVAAAGALGPQPEPALPDASPAIDAVDPAESDGPERASPGVDEGSEPSFDRAAVAFPATYLGLPVTTVATTIERRDERPADRLVAVGGYLSLAGMSWTCFDAYLESDQACAGRAVLTDVPVDPYGQPTGTGFGRIGAHLHPKIAPGTRVPFPSDDPGDPRAVPLPVIVLGSFGDPRLDPCIPERRECHNGFMIERVVWVAGETWDVTLTVDPALQVEPNIPEIRASIRLATARMGGSPVVLATSVIRPGLLATVDAAAARALPAIPAARSLRPVTYVRALFQDVDSSRPIEGRDPAIGWIVLESISGEVLARGGGTAPAP